MQASYYCRCTHTDLCVFDALIQTCLLYMPMHSFRFACCISTDQCSHSRLACCVASAVDDLLQDENDCLVQREDGDGTDEPSGGMHEPPMHEAPGTQQPPRPNLAVPSSTSQPMPSDVLSILYICRSTLRCCVKKSVSTVSYRTRTLSLCTLVRQPLWLQSRLCLVYRCSLLSCHQTTISKNILC